MKDRNLADVLWNRYRAWADATVSDCAPEANREEARGKAYQWVVQHIATWLDQIEQEANFEKRTQLITRLLYGPLPESGSVDFGPLETNRVDPKEAPAIHAARPNRDAKRSVFGAPETDRTMTRGTFGYGQGWSDFCP